MPTNIMTADFIEWLDMQRADFCRFVHVKATIDFAVPLDEIEYWIAVYRGLHRGFAVYTKIR
jgi:hypothetical protein